MAQGKSTTITSQKVNNKTTITVSVTVPQVVHGGQLVPDPAAIDRGVVI